MLVGLKGLEDKSAKLGGRVTLTRPPVVVPKTSISSGLLVPPLGLAYLAGSLRKAGFEVSIVDPVAEDPLNVNPVPGRPVVTYGLPIDEVVRRMPADTRCIGVSCMFSHEWPEAKKLIRALRARFGDTPIVVGGEHVTAAPQFSLQDCPEVDVVVVGEGEETIVELVRALSAGGDLAAVPGLHLRDGGGLQSTATRPRIRAIDAIPRPAWDLVPVENFLANGLSYGVSDGRTMPIMATRGCPFQCTFCSNPQMWTTRWVARDPLDVVDEIETYVREYGARNFDFYDLTAILKRDWVVKFCEELVRRDLGITWQLPAGTRSEAIDEEVARLLAAANHRNIVYAPETGSQRLLDLIKKKVKKPNMLASMRACAKHGISVKMNMIVGFPGETRRDILHTYYFLVQTAMAGVDDATLATFSPYPGSALFDELQASGRIPKVMDDDFFYKLALMGDVTNAESYNHLIPSRELLIYKLMGILLFYSSSYALRPQRFLRTASNLRSGRHETRIEKALAAYLDKWKLAGASGEAVESPRAVAPA